MSINPLMFCGGMPNPHHHHGPPPPHPTHPPHHHHHPHPHPHHLHHHPASHIHHTVSHHPPPTVPTTNMLHQSAAPISATVATPAMSPYKNKKKKTPSIPARPQKVEKKPCSGGVLEHMKDSSLVMLSDDHIIIMKAKYPKVGSD